MSIATTLFIVIGCLFLYYAGMVSYDIYADKMSKAEADEAKEEPVDVSDQLEDFSSLDVSKPDEETLSRKSFESFVCKGLTPEKMNSLMEDAAEGTPNETLKNILFMCYQIPSETSDQQQ